MKNKRILILVCLLLLNTTGCSMKQVGSDLLTDSVNTLGSLYEAYETVSEFSDELDTQVGKAKVGKRNLEEVSWQDLAFSVKGQVIKLGDRNKDLHAVGFKATDPNFDYNKEFDSSKMICEDFIYNGINMLTKWHSLESEVSDVNNAQLYAVELITSSLKVEDAVVLADNLTLTKDTKVSDIICHWGNPTFSTGANPDKTYVWETDDGSTTFIFKDKKLQYLKLESTSYFND